ncbi:MAG: ArnT family glycosyltransferase [Bryobacteraceae bacterium]
MQSRFFLFALLALIVFLIHAPLLRLPFYWDELGQFVPASLDLFHTGAWVPYTTVPNVHPPGVMAYLAAFWSLAGYSVPATRVAMLLLATGGALAVFLLAIELAKNAPGMPAFTAIALLLLSPLFVSQSMLAQLDMPAMVFTCLALLLFFQEKTGMAAAACCVLAMVKETGIVLPIVLGGWLFYEGRRREAVWFAAPILPLAAWLILLRYKTGHLFGSPEFTDYNLLYPLNPVRLVLALLRRIYYLFIGTFHWIGTVAVIYAWRRARLFRDRRWRIATLFVAAQVLLVTVVGGAVLERYLLPVLPIVYIAFAVAFEAYTPKPRLIGQLVLFPALILANFVNPPYPFPLENNLAFATFVSLNQRAAEFVQARYPDSIVATSFPLAGALRRPDFGYVSRQMKVREVKDFSKANIVGLEDGSADVLIRYSTAWDPLHLLRHPGWVDFLHRYYGYEPPVSRGEAAAMLHMRSVGRWTRNGQWIEVLARD